jgi:hypothetical protein
MGFVHLLFVLSAFGQEAQWKSLASEKGVEIESFLLCRDPEIRSPEEVCGKRNANYDTHCKAQNHQYVAFEFGGSKSPQDFSGQSICTQSPSRVLIKLKNIQDPIGYYQFISSCSLVEKFAQKLQNFPLEVQTRIANHARETIGLSYTDWEAKIQSDSAVNVFQWLLTDVLGAWVLYLHSQAYRHRLKSQPPAHGLHHFKEMLLKTRMDAKVVTHSDPFLILAMDPGWNRGLDFDSPLRKFIYERPELLDQYQRFRTTWFSTPQYKRTWVNLDEVSPLGMAAKNFQITFRTALEKDLRKNEQSALFRWMIRDAKKFVKGQMILESTPYGYRLLRSGLKWIGISTLATATVFLIYIFL